MSARGTTTTTSRTLRLPALNLATHEIGISMRGPIPGRDRAVGTSCSSGRTDSQAAGLTTCNAMNGLLSAVKRIEVQPPNMKKPLSAILAILAVACASVPANGTTAGNKSRATVSVVSLLPPQGEVMNGNTVIEAEIRYAIDGFRADAEYYLAPLFDSTAGEGRTFNKYDRVTDGQRITAPSGTLRIRYPIAREWSDGKLAKPVRVSFYIMLRTGERSAKVIGKTPGIQFGPAVSSGEDS